MRTAIRCFAVLSAAAIASSTGLVHASAAADVVYAMGPAAPSSEQRREFASLRAEAYRAGEAGDWQGFLDLSMRAFAVLPESAESHGQRAQLMHGVGSWRIDERSADTVRRSVAVLRIYKSQLERTHGSSVEDYDGWRVVQEHLAALEKRLPPEPADAVVRPPPPTPDVSTAPVDAEPPPRRPSTAFWATGGVLTGVGTALLVAGFVFVGRWRRDANAYRDYASDCRSMPENMLTLECQKPQSNSHWNDYREEIGPALGLVIPGALLLGTGVALVVVAARSRDSRTTSHRAHATWGGFRLRF